MWSVVSENLFGSLGTSKRVLALLESEEEFGGPQSIDDVCKNLHLTNRNARSILSKMTKRNEIDRIGQGIYRAIGDDREFVEGKSHFGD